MPNDQVFTGLVEPQGFGEEPLFFITRCFLLFYQGLFEQFISGSYKWSVDEKITEIEITDQVPIPRTRIEQKPQIVTMRGPARFANLSLDQMRTVNVHTGAKERTDLVSCTMAVNCIAKNGLEAQRIATIVARYTRDFKQVLQQLGRMHKVGDDIEIGPESPPGAFVAGEVDPEWTLVVVQLPFYFQWTDKVSPLNSPLLKSIEVRIKTAELPAAASTTQGSIDLRSALSPPTIRGKVINSASPEETRVGEVTQTVKT